MKTDSIPENVLIYDAECYFCSNYVRLLSVRESLGDITLINARDSEAVKAFHIEPQLLNEGMMLILGGNRYYGADAIHHIALLSTSSRAFNKINAAIFRIHGLARLFYPLLKAGRRVYLFLSGKGQIL